MNLPALTNEQLETYKRDGYLVVPDVLSPAECDQALALFKEHSGAEYSEIVNPHKKFQQVMDIMKRPQSVAILEALQGTRVCGLQSMFVWKKAGTPDARKAWNVHQDATYLKTEFGTYLGGDYLLDDHDKENGCLYFYPGSHNEPLLEYDPTKSEGDNPGNKVREIPPQYKKVDLVAKKGSFLIIHGNVMHGSYANVSADRSRATLLQAFINEGAYFYPGHKGDRVAIPLHD